MAIANTFFKKIDEHYISYKSGPNRTVIDYILIRRRDIKSMTNVKIIPGEAIATQYRILVADMNIKMPRQTRQRNREKKIKWYDLKDENKRDELIVKLSEQTERWTQEHHQPEWHEITDTIQECAKQILGES